MKKGYNSASFSAKKIPFGLTGQSTWHLWWTRWHWDRIFSQNFGFSLWISFHQCSTLQSYP